MKKIEQSTKQKSFRKAEISAHFFELSDNETEIPCPSAKAERSLTQQERMSRSGAKNWCFTYNRENGVPDEEWEQMVERFQTLGTLDSIKYLVFQQERGSGSSRDHLQGYVMLNRRCTLATVKRDVFLSTTVHLEVARGTPTQNKTYCTKEDGRVAGPWEFGDMTTNQGQRSDMDEAAALVKNSGAAQVALDLPNVYIRYTKGLHALEAQLSRSSSDVMRPPVSCAVLWGPTDVGKSHAALTLDTPEQTFIVPIQNSGALWFDGYCGQRTIVFDDFDPKCVPYRTLLRICDRYRLELPVKGGFVVGKWSNVVFTANDPPNQWYQSEEPYQGGPLERRLGLVLACFDRGSCGLFRASFITTFYDEIAFDELNSTVSPEVHPEVAGNTEQQLPGTVAESENLPNQEGVAESDAAAFVGGFQVDELDLYEEQLATELAALVPDDELTEPFGSFEDLE